PVKAPRAPATCPEKNSSATAMPGFTKVGPSSSNSPAPIVANAARCTIPIFSGNPVFVPVAARKLKLIAVGIPDIRRLAKCGRKGFVADHIIPLECGGADVASNLQCQTVPNSPSTSPQNPCTQ